MRVIAGCAAMPRFFFHVHNDVDTLDEEGRELASGDAALKWAATDVRSLAAASVREQGQLVLDHYVRVTDEMGDVVGTIRFGDAVRVEREPRRAGEAERTE